MTASPARTLILPARPDGTPLVWPVLPSQATLEYTLDLAAPMADAATAILGVWFSFAPSGTGEMAAAALTVSGSKVTVSLGPAPPARVYHCLVQVATGSGDEMAWTVVLPVSADEAPYPITPPQIPGFGTPLHWGGGALRFNTTGNSDLLIVG